MALEHYKTQVLLLHSQQGTLDKLSTGFSDRYTVHCATSGSEALNTLVDTPIHVIVSAHDLPGMSGLDALREARKRSPDTIGILLAGTDKQDGLEALVGDKEVFQIVRGEIAPQALRDLIDDATKRVRLSTLSESANDHAANLDHPVAEHIIMETSPNGSAIISDGTGTMPALKPQKIQVTPDIGGRSIDVLVLSRDEEFLVTVRDSTRGLHNVHHVSTLAQAEEIAKQNKIGVLVTDAAMVGSNVEALTRRLRADVPRLVAIVAGRRDDGEMLMDLINRGQVYRFLLKPVSPGRARLAIEASVKHHLEAADSVFAQPSGATAGDAVQAAKAGAGAMPGPVAKAAPKSAQQRRAAARPPAKPAAARAKPRKTPTISAMPLDDDFDDPFSDSGSFSETMTGIVTSVGKTLSNAAASLRITGKSKAPAKAEKAGKAAADAAGAVDPQPAPAPVSEPPPPAQPATAAPAKPAPRPAATASPKPPRRPAAAAAQAPVAEPIPVAAPTPVPETTRVPQVAATAPEPAAIDVGNEPGSRGPRYLAIAAGLALLAAGFVWMQGDNGVTVPVLMQEQPANVIPKFAESDVPLTAPAQSGLAVEPPVDDVLAQARAARDAGQLIEPPGANAVELYVAARDRAPDDVVIAAEIEQLTDRLFSLAESALLEQQSAEAAAIISMARLTSPGSPRLAFLDAQLLQMQLRQSLDQARAAIRENRFEDAANSLSQAEFVAGGDLTEITLLAEELSAARSEQRIEDVLAMAAERLESNQLVSPSNDNARYYFGLALENDPQNTAAGQGLLIVAGKLVLGAREAIDDGNFADADQLLADAQALDPASAELAATGLALKDAKDAQAAAERQAAAARQAEIERRAAAEREAAERQAAELEAKRLADLEAERQAELEAQRQAAELEAQRQAAELEAERSTAARVAAAAAAAVVLSSDADAGAAGASSFAARGVADGADVSAGAAADMPTGASVPADTAAESGMADSAAMPAAASAEAADGADLPQAGASAASDTTLLAAAAAARTTLDLDGGLAAATAGQQSGGSRRGASTAPPAVPQMVGMNKLVRSNYVTPKYPRSAMRRNITGSVDVSFTVQRDGSVGDVTVIESTPGSVFDQAALEAVQQWEFEPVIEDGRSVEKRSAVRMAFDLQ